MTVLNADFKGFGYRELAMAGELLIAYAENGQAIDILGGNVSVGFNTGSGNVFLYDEEYNTVMMNGDKLELYVTCLECGEEGFKSEVELHDSTLCKKCHAKSN